MRHVNSDGVAYGLGRRKTSQARVNVWRNEEGKGKMTVNGQGAGKYFLAIKELGVHELLLPFDIIGEPFYNFDVRASVKGGGLTGQTGAVRLGISRALIKLDPEWQPKLRKAGLLTRDPRMKERKKPGQAGARKKFAWVKR